MRLLAIDPASHKCGIAIFHNGELIETRVLCSDESTPLNRRLDIARSLSQEISLYDEIVSEEPFLQGRNNNGMQRLLGMIEKMTEGKVHFVHPMTVKKFCGGGSLDKLEVALAAGQMLKTSREQNMIADLIQYEEWDATDAVAIGLTYLMGSGK